MMLPLEGIRILDLSQHFPGEYCTCLLGDLGADVLRVDQPDRPGRSEEMLSRNEVLDRNKRSIALNLKLPAAREILYKLVEGWDVVLEGYRPGVAKRLGVDYETLRGFNPRLIYCSISGYGQSGPYQQLAGHDINYMALSGILGLSGSKEGPPIIPGINVADLGGGTMFAAIGILTAIIAREKTGKGQYVDVAMLDGLLSWLSGIYAATYLMRGIIPRRGELQLGGARPGYNLYETADGCYITLGVLEPWFWERLCKALGREDFIPHQNASGERRQEVFAAFRQIFKTKTRDEWFEFLREQDIEVAPLYSFEEVFADPQVLHRGMVVEVPRPNGGHVKQIGIPIKFSETPGTVRSAAPRTGQHTEEVLRGLGYPSERIEALRREGAIG